MTSRFNEPAHRPTHNLTIVPYRLPMILSFSIEPNTAKAINANSLESVASCRTAGLTVEWRVKSAGSQWRPAHTCLLNSAPLAAELTKRAMRFEIHSTGN